MAYEPTTWKSGDVVTSEKLNKIEQGIAAGSSGGNGAMTVGVVIDGNTITLDKTWKELAVAIKTNFLTVYMPISEVEFYRYPVISILQDPENSMYSVFAIDTSISGFIGFFTDTENGYPYLTIPEVEGN
jgi:hypothetical protein